MEELRLYNKSDREALSLILLSEGVQPPDMKFEEYATWILEDDGLIGFFTLRREKGLPNVVHFAVSKERRSMSNARKLVKALVIKARHYGKTMILHSKKDYLDKIIRYYFKTKPYTEADGYRFYIVKLGRA